jgi:hypothetical protein
MAERRLKARYMVKGPIREAVTFNKCHMDEKTKSLIQKEVTEEKECFYVLFPNGHSIRLTSREKLKELGFDKKPRIVDMDTGDVVEVGGDPYDFGDNPLRDLDVALTDDLGDGKKKPSKTL